MGRGSEVLVAQPPFQVDTGPLVVPGWIAGEELSGGLVVERFAMAFVAYNVLDGHTEFVLRAVTPVGDAGSDAVWHYSRVVRTRARHELFACA